MSILMKPRKFPVPTNKTKRVWEIADALTKKTGKLANRKDVIRAYVAEGRNANTASTQYSQWKKQRLIEHGEKVVARTAGNTAPLRLSIGADGRLLIPASLRAAMMLDDAGAVTAWVVDGELHVISSAGAVEQLQNLVARIDTGTGPVVDELIKERRAEAMQDGQG